MINVTQKILIATCAAAIVAVGGSLIHPFRTPSAPANNQASFKRRRSIRKRWPSCSGRARTAQNTEWPWYSHVAPVSWLLVHDVQQARSHMNLSRWQDYSAGDRLRLLSEIGSAVRNRKMPVQRYLLLHPEARLTNAERQEIYRWTRSERSRLSVRQTQGTSPSLAVNPE